MEYYLFFIWISIMIFLVFRVWQAYTSLKNEMKKRSHDYSTKKLKDYRENLL